MNRFIKEELNKVISKTSEWDEDTLSIHVYKQGSSVNKEDFVVGNKYLISIEDYIINEPPNFTLSSNWNSNTVPPEKELFVVCLQIMGKMLKFKCKGKTTNIEWEGWIPKKAITIL